MNAAAPPSCWISATTFAPSFSRRPERTTLAPARANSVAVVLPMPEVPPVTSATLSESFFVFIQFPFAVVEFLKAFLLQVVGVEPVVNDAVPRDELCDVILHILLSFGRQIAQTEVAFFVIPRDDFGAGMYLGMLPDPLRDLIIGCTVHGASGEHIAAERSARAARVFFTIPQIARQQLH